MSNFIRYLIVCCCLSGSLFGETQELVPIAYEVSFTGVDNSDTLTLLRCTSELVTLQDTPPKTAAALKIRVEDDIANLHKVLQSKAYYHATISASIDGEKCPVLVTLNIDTGPQYPFESFKIVPAEGSCLSFPLDSILPADLGITLCEPAYPSAIIEAEDRLLDFLGKQGYPLAAISCREVSADQTNKTINVILFTNTGPQATFGMTTIEGKTDILPIFFCKKIYWRLGEVYNPEAICRTLNDLESSGLFTSINISHAEEVDADGSLPMIISVKEGRHRSIAFGAGYATDLGPGVTAEWEHRNMRNRGERLSLLANIWQIKQEGFIKYVQPDFGDPSQDLIWKAELEHEITKGFEESSLNLSATIERQVNDELRISYGTMFTLLRNSHSNNNGDFNIFKLPMQALWTHTNSLLDPTKGIAVHFKTTPALQTLKPRCSYCTNILTTSSYVPLDCEANYVLAAKLTLGSIVGTSDRRLPPSERLYAGTDTLLRGYEYMTVSPLGHHHKPIGGRSMMIFSFESRMKVYDPFGIVLFYDVGNVYKPTLPQFNHKQLQSAGVGFRYHTPVGPIRLDVAVPLDRRKHLDPAFQVYFSIGQAF